MPFKTMRKNGIWLTCEKCGDPFYCKRADYIVGRKIHFCSAECAGTVRNGESFICEACGSVFYRNAGQIARGAVKTCSKDCMWATRKGKKHPRFGRRHSSESISKMTGPNHHSWTGWTVKRRPLWPAFRKRFLASQCARCGATNDLEIDHIIPVFAGGDRTPGNLQTLCHPCNMRKHFYEDLPKYRIRLES